jgi:hypothetical protein
MADGDLKQFRGKSQELETVPATVTFNSQEEMKPSLRTIEKEEQDSRRRVKTKPVKQEVRSDTEPEDKSLVYVS